MKHKLLENKSLCQKVDEIMKSQFNNTNINQDDNIIKINDNNYIKTFATEKDVEMAAWHMQKLIDEGK